MKLQQLIEQYISYRKSLGEQQNTNGCTLRSFGRAIGANIDVTDVSPRQVDEFLAGSGPVTLNWHVKFSVLQNFYSYAVSRGYVVTAPLPSVIPKRPPPFIPYIYPNSELRRLLQTAGSYKRSRSMEANTIRTILLLLYGAGLRLREAIDLDNSDVDFDNSIITVTQSKFGKTRLLPFGKSLGQSLQAYAAKVARPKPDGPFFVSRTGNRLVADTLQHNFRILCELANVRRTDGARYQPRIHDLRHSFAVHRLTLWYEQGADVNVLLPLLSVYMGHVHLRHTQVYLTMTPDLLHQAGKRFEVYAGKEEAHV